MPTPFRDVEKEAVLIRMPIPLATLLRERAAKERRSISDLGTMLVISGLSRKPESFGIQVPEPAA
jgi:hypothetical protein